MKFKGRAFQPARCLLLPSAVFLGMLPPEERCTKWSVAGCFDKQFDSLLTGEVDGRMVVVWIESMVGNA